MSKDTLSFQNVQEKFEEIQKVQSAFVSKFLNRGLELQKKHYELVANIVANQIEFNNTLFSGAFNIINDNIHAAEKKEAKAN